MFRHLEPPTISFLMSPRPTRPFLKRNDLIRRHPRKNFLLTIRPAHINRSDTHRMPQPKVQPPIVIGTVTGTATYFVDPHSRTPRTMHHNASADAVAIRNHADQTDPQPMVIVLRQVD